MTLDQLEMLEAIVLEGSMQKAAKRIHKSQPSLSVGIKKIEELYNIKIFSRDSYRPKLTKAGEVFYQNALRVLESHRKLHKVASELGEDVEPRINIIVDPIVLLSRVSSALDTAIKKSDTTQLIFMEDVLEGPLDTLIRGQATFAIGHCPPHRSHEVLKKKLGHVELIPVIKKGIDYNAVPNIFVTNNVSAESEHKSTEHTWFVSSHSRKEELILAGYGWGRMSKLKIKDLAGAVVPVKAKADQKISLDVFLMIKKDEPLLKVSKEIWDSI